MNVTPFAWKKNVCVCVCVCRALLHSGQSETLHQTCSMIPIFTPSETVCVRVCVEHSFTVVNQKPYIKHAVLSHFLYSIFVASS